MRRFNHGKNKISADTFVADFDTRNVSTGSSSTNQLKLNFSPLFNTPRTVDWGDGVIDIVPGGTAAFTHNYSVEGVYTVKIKANTFAFTFNNTNDLLKILEVKSWGTYTIVDQTFWGCSNLVLHNTSGKPTVFSCGLAFFNCTSIATINGINDWDFSTTPRIDAFLAGCTSFNQSLNLNTVNVTNANGAFQGCVALNSYINLNLLKATNITNLFSGCTSFSPTILYIDAPLATFAQTTFTGCPLNTTTDFYCNIPKVTNPSSLLASKPNFNPTNFYLNINDATDINRLFFGNTNFNPTNFTIISNNVTNAYGALFGCSNFNKPLTFNTDNITDMRLMLGNCFAFNQDISSLTFNKNVLLSDFMSGKSATNYNALYYSNLLKKFEISFIGVGRTASKLVNCGSIKRDASGTTARANLVADGWTISDGGMI